MPPLSAITARISPPPSICESEGKVAILESFLPSFQLQRNFCRFAQQNRSPCNMVEGNDDQIHPLIHHTSTNLAHNIQLSTHHQIVV